MVVSGFYECVYALQKYRSYQKNLSDIALLSRLKDMRHNYTAKCISYRNSDNHHRYRYDGPY